VREGRRAGDAKERTANENSSLGTEAMVIQVITPQAQEASWHVAPYLAEEAELP
jgi:hypothetical protein